VPERLRDVETWVRSHRASWEARFDRLGSFLERDTQ
jgi:hypothetical protein